jgi:hypothetical protein
MLRNEEARKKDPAYSRRAVERHVKHGVVDVGVSFVRGVGVSCQRLRGPKIQHKEFGSLR